MPFDTTLDPTTDVILGAIDYLEKYGWRKGGKRGPDEEGCVLQAMCAAAAHRAPDLLTRAVRRVERANGIICLPFWNDAQGRTKEQVLEALRNSLITGE